MKVTIHKYYKQWQRSLGCQEGCFMKKIKNLIIDVLITASAYYIMCSLTHHNSWQSIVTLLIVALCCSNNRAEKGDL